MAKNRRPSFQFYPGDWLGSKKIALMKPEHEGGYIRLMSYMWDDPDCSLPDDDEQLAILSRLDPERYPGAISVVKKCFKKHPKKIHFLTHERLLLERKKQNAWRKKCKKGGKNSAKTRWGSGNNGDKKEGKGSYETVTTKLKGKGNTSSSFSSSLITPPTPRTAGGVDEHEILNPRARGDSPRQRAQKITEEEAAIREAEEECQQRRAECRQFERDAWTEIEKAEQDERERIERQERWPELYPEISELDFDAFHHREDPVAGEIPCDGEFEVYDLSPAAMNLMRSVYLRCQLCGHQITAENPRGPDLRMQDAWRMNKSVEELLDERAAELRAPETPCVSGESNTPCAERSEM
ncbi:MAG: YdaU family protein [Actinobacteria bacterium]|nr:YdaU family protein [Actinomycetota bacterium]